MPNIIDFMSVVSVFTALSVFFAYLFCALEYVLFSTFVFRFERCAAGLFCLVRYSRMHAGMPEKEVLRRLYGQKNGETLLCLL